jgi:hypothetical protein
MRAKRNKGNGNDEKENYNNVYVIRINDLCELQQGNVTLRLRHHSSLHGKQNQERKDTVMLVTIAVILIILWLLGVITSYTIGGFIHVLLVIAIVVVLVRVIRGRNIIDGTKN